MPQKDTLGAVSQTPQTAKHAEWNPELLAWLRARALAEGFDLASVAPADPDPNPTETRFADWIAAGNAAEMDYLKRRNEQGELLRARVQNAVPWAKSVIVCAFNYNAAGPRSIDPAPEATGWIARYAWNGDSEGNPIDYHDDLLRRLRAIEADLQIVAPCQSRCYVDTGPLLERDLAARAGLGWIGRNTCLINQQLGSWLFLAAIATSLPLATQPTLQLHPDRCGSCTACIDACPTQALLNTPDSRGMDASRCIAYLTIEHKGPIADNLHAGIGRNVFGCDICQEVCPWNRRAPIADKPGLAPRPNLINPPLATLAALTPAAFRHQFRGSPLERTRHSRLHRNTAIALGNTPTPAADGPLRHLAASDNMLVAEAATRALNRRKNPRKS
jgi:epoxyqueuosine reductase